MPRPAADRTAVYSLVDVDGTRYVATGRTQIRKLFDNLAAPEIGNDEDDNGDFRSLVVQSVVTIVTPVTVRCPSG